MDKSCKICKYFKKYCYKTVGFCDNLNRWEKADYQISQMDLDALESLRTGRKGYSGTGEYCRVISIKNHYRVSYEDEFFDCMAFTFQKPIEIPPKGTIVECSVEGESWSLYYSTGKMENDDLVVSFNNLMISPFRYYKNWRLPK